MMPAQRFISATLGLAAISVAQVFAGDHYATNVPDVINWQNESRAEGNPPNADCNNSNYSVSEMGTNYVIATQFGSIGIPAGQAVDRVRVQALARYDLNEGANARIRATWTGLTGSSNQVYTIDVGDTNCRWFTLDITNQEDFWTAAELDSIQVAIRRESGTSTRNALRVKAFRIQVDYATDCNGNLIPDYRDIAMGATDCDGNGVPDQCQLPGNDCNGNGVLDACEFANIHVANDSASVPFGGNVLINLVANDASWDPSRFRVVLASQPFKGVLQATATLGLYRYVSSGGPYQCGGDGFSYRLEALGSCAAWRSALAQVSVTVQAQSPDCNSNCRDDALDISTGLSLDCNGDGRPDECVLQAAGDAFNVEFGRSTRLVVTANDPDWAPEYVRPVVINGPQYGSAQESSTVGAIDFFSSNAPGEWGPTQLTYRLEGIGNCIQLTSQEVTVFLNVVASPNDCNGNYRDDLLDIEQGFSRDCDGDGIPTECETGIEDCNVNGVDDCYELDHLLVTDIDGSGVPDVCETFNQNFCVPMTNSAGCQSLLQFTGSPSYANCTFEVAAVNLLHPTFGLLLWSRRAAANPVPFGAGTLCLDSPIQRTRVQASIATVAAPPCNGRLGFQWTRADLTAANLQPGTRVYCQFWSRDAGSLGGSNITDGVEFVVLP